MPTYRYECRSCGAFHEEFQSIKAKSLTKCPTCGGRLDRLIGTGSGILLKGSGFHNTDYRSSAYKESAKGDSAPAATTSESSSGSTGGSTSGDAGSGAGEKKSGEGAATSAPKSDPKSEPKKPSVEKKSSSEPKKKSS